MESKYKFVSSTKYYNKYFMYFFISHALLVFIFVLFSFFSATFKFALNA